MQDESGISCHYSDSVARASNSELYFVVVCNCSFAVSYIQLTLVLQEAAPSFGESSCCLSLVPSLSPTSSSSFRVTEMKIHVKVSWQHVIKAQKRNRIIALRILSPGAAKKWVVYAVLRGLHPGEITSVYIVQGSGERGAPGLIWTGFEKEKHLCSTGVRGPNLPAHREWPYGIRNTCLHLTQGSNAIRFCHCETFLVVQTVAFFARRAFFLQWC